MILFITRKYPPSIGGMQTLSYRLTKEISKQTPTCIISWGGSQWWLPLFVIKAFIQSLVLLIKGNIVLIHLSDLVLAPLGIVLGTLGRVPVVANAHGLDVTYPHPLYQAMISLCLPRLKLIICNSSYVRKECNRHGISPEQCIVIPPGVDIEDHIIVLSNDMRQKQSSLWKVDLLDRHVLLSVGRLVPRKGLVAFITEVLPLLLTLRQDWVYLIVGDGPERATIEAVVEAQGLSGHVRLLGQLDNNALRTAYALADLFVMPNVPISSNPEGFGMVVLEARAAGKPVVAADLEGIRDAVGGEKDGTLVKPCEWANFVAAINAWLEHEETVADQEQRRQRVEAQFAWDQIAKQYLEVFREVIEKYDRRRRK